MLCPFCLGEVRLQRRLAVGSRWPIHLCPQCNQQVPALYVSDYRKYPPVVVSAVGFRQHGKTVYFASLFHALKRLKLADHWTYFFTMALNEDSLDTVYENVALLEKGELPDSTPKNFPRPIMIRLHGVPSHPNCTLLCYDTAGECFERPTELVQFASFVRRAESVMLLYSLGDLESPDVEMHQLLNSYVVGLGELQGRTQQQRLTVVYTKADQLHDLFGEEYEDVYRYLEAGTVEDLAVLDGYAEQQQWISFRLRQFTATRLGADEFLHAVDEHFQEVTFCAVSALGAAPEGHRLPVKVSPRRVLDPLFAVMDSTHSRWSRLQWWLWRRLRMRR